MYIYIYIYIHIYTYLYSIQQEIKFICKSFRLCLYQLHIYTATVIKFTNSFFINFDFSLLQEWEYQYKKIYKKTVVTKLRETRTTMTNHNLDKSN